MRVVLPFAVPDGERLQPWALSASILAMRQDGWNPTLVYMEGNNSYYDLLSKCWKQRESFCIIEHDIVVWPGALTELDNCNELWCTRPYYCSVGWILDGLGCTKFDEQLIHKFPNFLDPPFPTCCQHTTYFCGLDRLIAHRMQDLGIKPHVHLPGVTNLNGKWT